VKKNITTYKLILHFSYFHIYNIVGISLDFDIPIFSSGIYVTEDMLNDWLNFNKIVFLYSGKISNNLTFFLVTQCPLISAGIGSVPYVTGGATYCHTSGTIFVSHRYLYHT